MNTFFPSDQTTGSTRLQSREHIFASLSFLRGLSALAVLIGHTRSSITSKLNIFPLNMESFAVDVFMLISGFLMMWHFYERKNKGEKWGSRNACIRFYIRRFFRIAPLYYIMLALIWMFHSQLDILARHNSSIFHQNQYFEQPAAGTYVITPENIVSHITFIFGLIPEYSTWHYLPDWSIGLEMQFYLVFPFLALFLVRSQFVGGVLVMLAIGWVSFKLFGTGFGQHPGPGLLLGTYPFPTLLPFRINCFLAGMLMAAGIYEKENFAKRTFLLLLALLISGLYLKKLLVVCFILIVFETAINYGSGFARLDTLVFQIKNRVFENVIIKFMADTSYGVYLLHIPLLTVLIWSLSDSDLFLSLSPIVRFLSLTFFMIPSVYLIAYMAFKYIETPGIAMGRNLIKRFT